MYFVTENQAIRIDRIVTVEIDHARCEVRLDTGAIWYLSKEDGHRLLNLLDLS
jgi:hypothetical protein